MVAFSIRRHLPGTLPALTVAAVMLALWAYGRWGYLPPGQREGVADALTVGWLCALFLTATAACVVWAATAPRATYPRGRLFFGYSCVIDVCGLLLIALGLSSTALPWLDIGAIYLLLAAWTCFITALTAGLRRWGSGVAAAGGMAVAMTLLASPIVAMPLVHAAAGWGPGWQPRVVAVITHTCPLLALIDALRPAMGLEWGQLPLMYRYSGLGQSIPAVAGPWWQCTLGYGLLAMPLASFARRRPPSARPFAVESLEEPPARVDAARPPAAPERRAIAPRD